MSKKITRPMIDAGLDASLLCRGSDADPEEMVLGIYRAMESARQIDHEVSTTDHQDI